VHALKVGNNNNNNQVAIESPNVGPNKTHILEIGFGRGYCTLLLAGLLPASDFEFHGLDIVERHVDVARADAAKYPNVRFHHGDAAATTMYAKMPSFDVIFAIESLCHMDSPERMRCLLTNASKHLLPGGCVVIIDGFRSETFGQSPPDQQLAMRLAERAFGIQRMHPMSEWIEAAYPTGLALKRLDDLTAHAIPFWTLGWRFAHAFLRHAPVWVIRRLRATPYTARSTDNLLAVATVAHAMRNRASAVYGVMVFGKAEM
jgi:SAM-dependent methyltransferase